MQKFLFRIFYPTQKLRLISKDLSVFLRQHLETNLSLLYIISLFLMISESILLVTPERAFNYHTSLTLFLLVNTVLLLILTVVKKDYQRYSYFQLNLLQMAIITNVLVLATNLNISSITKTDYIHPFIIALTFLATGLQLSPRSLTIILFITGSVNLIGMSLYQTNQSVYFICFTNITVFTTIAWMLGIMVSRMRVTSWLDNREIIAQNEILADLTKRDSMTRFFNHESIISHLRQQIQVSIMNQHPLSVLILDVDDFKRINDTYGHLKGDDVLLMIAKNINLTVRECDIIGRYGGEEFFLIFPNTDLQSARLVSERIRISIEEDSSLRKFDITISGGLALYEGEGLDEIIRKSDDRLYVAKGSGKNQIISA